jgi:hypothetical protein
MGGPEYYSAAIREAWEEEAKRRWDDRTHGRGLSLLIVKMLALPGSLMPSSARVANLRILARPEQDPRTFHGSR